jgi:hypothetical protein
MYHYSSTLLRYLPTSPLLHQLLRMPLAKRFIFSIIIKDTIHIYNILYQH